MFYLGLGGCGHLPPPSPLFLLSGHCTPPSLNSTPLQVLRTFNAHTKELDLGHTLTDYFEEQAAQRPHHPCLIFEEVALTYTEVDTEANMVGHFLQRRCVWGGGEGDAGGGGAKLCGAVVG